MTSLDLSNSIESLKKTFPQLRFILTHQQDKNLFIRFACRKIVQNMIINKEKVQITLITPERKVLQRSVNIIPNQDHLDGLVNEMLQQAEFTEPLDYTPSPIDQHGHWGREQFSGPVPIAPLMETVGTLLGTGQSKGLENLAGYLQNERQKTRLISSDGGDLVHESSCYQLEMSGFQDQYEITSGLLKKSWEELQPTEAFAPIEEWPRLPTTALTWPPQGKKMRVVLSAQAVASILAYAFYTDNFNALSIREGTSPLGKLIGKSLFHDSVQLGDQPFSQRIIYHPFDGVGHLRQNQAIIENGVFKNPLYNEREAKLQKFPYFSHCQSFRDSSAYPMDLEMAGTTKKISTLWQELGDGYYLHDVHYLSISDRQKMTLFGLTRGGFLKIENGCPVQKVQNMRFELSIRDLFTEVESLGQAEESRVWQGTVVAPSMLVQGIEFTQAATNL